MKIDTLIWSEVDIHDEKTNTLIDRRSNVAVNFIYGRILNIQQYTSSQGSLAEGPTLGYSYPEVIVLSPQAMCLRAYTWTGTKAKDRPVILSFKF